MPIEAVDHPPPKRRGNERLSAQEIEALAGLLRRGKCASDGESESIYQTIYNRARSAQRRVWEEHGIDSEVTIQRVQGGYKWILGPM